MISDEYQIKAAYIAQEAANTMQQAAYRIEEAIRELKFLTEDGYGNNVTKLIELLQKENSNDNSS